MGNLFLLGGIETFIKFADHKKKYLKTTLLYLVKHLLNTSLMSLAGSVSFYEGVMSAGDDIATRLLCLGLDQTFSLALYRARTSESPP